jgi:hypothetical protein
MATQAIPPPTPVVTFGPEPASFQEICRVLKTRRRVLVTKSAGGSLGMVTGFFLKLAISLIILKLMIFSRNFFYKIDA